MIEKPHKTLGRNVIPSNYKLSIAPDMKTFRFKGHEVIKAKINQPAKSITLNAKELKVEHAYLSSKGRKYEAKIRLNKIDETLTLSFGSPVKGDMEIVIDFEGVNNDQMYGFYKSRYTSDGKEGYILTTQFESTDARAAFPCIDEPEFKATFDLDVTINDDLKVISNMPIKSEAALKGGKKKTAFLTTPRMSTYLLYIGVGDFEFLSGKASSLPIRIVTVPGKIKYAGMALDFAKRFVVFYNKYFGIKYPLPKLDLIAIPDFAAGAMENWGAMTFREVAILGNSKITSVPIKRQMAITISHELVHQWFGDLVTMSWWDDLWLNESFANFMSYKALEDSFPEWRMKTEYVVDEVGLALAADQLISTHPISVRVNKPSEVDEIFDDISYAKGGSVLHMLEDYASEETFRQGLNYYLKKHEYGNATKYDLWNAIQHAAELRHQKVKISKVASYWVDASGYPMVDVKLSNGKASITQRRFLLLDKKIKGVWPIPLHYKTEGKQGFVLLEKKSGSIDLNGSDYIKLNYQQKGVYRVRYDDKILDKLGSLIKSKRISLLDAWGIENDLYSLVKSCRVPLDRYLGFIERYCLDCEYPLNFSVSQHLYGLSVLLHGKKPYPSIQRLILAYHRRTLERIGWECRKSDDDITIMLRSITIKNLGIAGDSATIRKAKALFNGYSKKSKSIDTNIKGAVYSINAWTGDSSTFKAFMDLYKKEQMPEEQRKLMYGLASFSDADIARKALDFSLSKHVRSQDSFAIPAIESGNYMGRQLLWPWTKANWKTLMKKFTAPRMLSSFVDNLGVVADLETKKEIVRFFADERNMRSDLKKALAQTLEIIDINIKFEKLQAHGPNE